MKKLFSFIAVVFLSFFLLQAPLFAASGNNADLKKLQSLESLIKNDDSLKKPQYLPEFAVSAKANSYDAAQSVIYRSINIILFVVGTIAVIVIIIGGFMYVVNSGSEDIQTKAKDTILYAAIGLIVVFLSYAVIENTIQYLYDEDRPENYDELNELRQEDTVNDAREKEASENSASVFFIVPNDSRYNGATLKLYSTTAIQEKQISSGQRVEFTLEERTTIYAAEVIFPDGTVDGIDNIELGGEYSL